MTSFSLCYFTAPHICTGWSCSREKKINEAHIEASVVFLLSHISHVPSCWLEATKGRSAEPRLVRLVGGSQQGKERTEHLFWLGIMSL